MTVSRIAELNDKLRRRQIEGRWLMTQGITALKAEDLTALIAEVETFDNFTADNDPYGEHDFGAIEHGGQTVFWKIDYYDLDCQAFSPDPADPAVTQRVLTIMLAEEY